MISGYLTFKWPRQSVQTMYSIAQQHHITKIDVNKEKRLSFGVLIYIYIYNRSKHIPYNWHAIHSTIFVRLKTHFHAEESSKIAVHSTSGPPGAVAIALLLVTQRVWLNTKQYIKCIPIISFKLHNELNVPVHPD